MAENSQNITYILEYFHLTLLILLILENVQKKGEIYIHIGLKVSREDWLVLLFIY